MLASHQWLMELTGLSLDPVEVARRFTTAGIEVEAARPMGRGLSHVIVAEVRSTRPHPKREKLRLVTVFDGKAEHEVVCGAPNVPAAGGRVVLAQLGARLPSGIEIAERDLGGVVSRGMLCSERELDVGSDESGILVLEPNARTVPGAPVAAALALEDTIFELSLTPNRADALGHIGLARELCALTGVPFALPKLGSVSRVVAPAPELFPQRDAVFELPFGSAAKGTSAAAGFGPVRVDIADGARCPRYGAGLAFGVKIGPSPFWLRYRLHSLGLRAISNVVDITNYILMLWGHPIHAFDYDRVRGSRIAVRLARAGERMRTLDGVERQLAADDLLICDGEGPVALAGVMGGENSSIDDSTQRVLIECAYFDPRSVRRTSKRTGLHTDSSHRFERGVDAEDTRAVLAHTLALIVELAGATAVGSALDVLGERLPERRIHLRRARASALLGSDEPFADAERKLTALGCKVTARTDGFDVVAPSHRPDLGREIDLIEELARIFGYDALPTELPRIAPSEDGTPAQLAFVRALRQSAAAAGLNEAVNFAFLSERELSAARAPEVGLRIVNPMSEDRSVLRTSLLPGLCANLRTAQNQQLESFAQFELARVFRPRPGSLLPDELLQLGILLWGARRSWYGDSDALDFYDGKAAVEALVRPLCGVLPETVLDPELPQQVAALHPKRSARVTLAGRRIGWLGELHPDVVEASGLSGRPVWAQLDVAELLAAIGTLGRREPAPLPRFPSATRDIAVVVSEEQAAGDVAAALRETASELAEAVTLFDVYRGEPIPAGRKSLAFHIVYRQPNGTLTDSQVDQVHERVRAAAERRFGGSLRG